MLSGDVTLDPIVPVVEVRFNVGVVMFAELVMLLLDVIDTDVVPFTAFVSVTPPPVGVSDTVSPEIAPPVLVTLVAATTLNAPPDIAVPACELPEIFILPADAKKIP